MAAEWGGGGGDCPLGGPGMGEPGREQRCAKAAPSWGPRRGGRTGNGWAAPQLYRVGFGCCAAPPRSRGGRRPAVSPAALRSGGWQHGGVSQDGRGHAGQGMETAESACPYTHPPTPPSFTTASRCCPQMKAPGENGVSAPHKSRCPIQRRDKPGTCIRAGTGACSEDKGERGAWGHCLSA